MDGRLGCIVASAPKPDDQSQSMQRVLFPLVGLAVVAGLVFFLVGNRFAGSGDLDRDGEGVEGSDLRGAGDSDGALGDAADRSAGGLAGLYGAGDRGAYR